MMKNTKLIMAITIAFALILAAPANSFAQSTNQSILMPGYKYPTTWTTDPYWDTVTAAGSAGVPFVIMNPSNGPGTAVNSDYVTQIADNTTSGIKNIGYVDTSYQTRPISDVITDIDRWYSMYGSISGIMFDQIDDANPSQVCYLASIYNYVKYYHPEAVVVANPGTHITDDLSPYADIFITAETTGIDYLSNYTAPTSSFETNPANQAHVMHIVHEVSASDYTAVMAKTRAENAGWIYITDDLMPNPYDQLPTNLSTLMADVSTLPQTTAPNGTVSNLPSGCVDIVADSEQTNPNMHAVVLMNLSESLQPMLIPATIQFTLPEGVGIISTIGSNWVCKGNTCTLNPRLATGASSADLAIRLEAVCGLVNQQVTYSAIGGDGTSYGSGHLAVTSNECGENVTTPNGTVTNATLASTGSSISLFISVSAVLIITGAALRRMYL